ncbi:probable exoglucanase-6A precursor [Rhynchosporium graminicola]|uniref:Glucanase n=1 Tax=Rhynchosporium graminicola TaxID=2792576 RepID=A0A1E1JQH7_9HELO|nr:probable exoglucanase-6A precursor [Rhynchosporium commune]
MTMKNAILAAAALVSVVSAQAPAYGQCGGKTWTGDTTCVSGYYCNPNGEYYSQCVPGAGPPSGPSGTTSRPSTSAPTNPPTNPTTPTTSKNTSSSSSGAPAGTPAVSSGNPFAGVSLYASPFYASEINDYAIPVLSGTLAAKAAAVAKVPTFVWLDTLAKVSLLEKFLGNIQALNAAGASPKIAGTFVVYDLPDRDCAALASNGEYSIANGGLAKYKTYIDTIKAILVKYSDVKTILVIEPDSLANMVTNLNVPKCAGAAASYKEGVTYAIQQLNLPQVSMYLDAGHAGWLGWPANVGPAATLFADLYKAAGSPKAVRGLATNVANYNAFSIATCPSYTQGNTNCDESRYINELAPLLTAAGFPAHFITDTSRSGKQPTGQIAWGDWCNVKNTGFGLRPSANTGNPLVDAFAWIKPGGECDGTSDTSAKRYDGHCGAEAALKPAPEAGTWFQAYFEQLLVNANPPF